MEALRLLTTLQRSATKAAPRPASSSAPASSAPPELRERLRELKIRELLETCPGFRLRTDDDSLAGTTRLVLRELAESQRRQQRTVDVPV